MKLDTHIQDSKPKIEISKEQEKKTEIQFDSNIIPHRGHTLFEIDVLTQKVSRAEFEQEDVLFSLNFSKESLAINKRVIKKEGVFYVSALNEKSALKKFKKGINGSKFNPNKNYHLL
jgi:hypothetical protein